MLYYFLQVVFCDHNYCREEDIVDCDPAQISLCPSSPIPCHVREMFSENIYIIQLVMRETFSTVYFSLFFRLIVVSLIYVTTSLIRGYSK